MIIKIDNRERDLISKCEYNIANIPAFKELKIEVCALPIGDIIINDGNEDLVIIERKTIQDLSASIKDGRYEEQSYRLNGLDHHNHNIVYLIEGDINKYNIFREKMDKLTIYSAMCSIFYFKGFSTMRSMDINESAIMICNMAYKIERTAKTSDKKAFYGKSISSEDTTSISIVPAVEKDYCNVVKKVKKDNVTPENIGEIMLCQIPNVSSTIALAVLTKYKTLSELMKAIKENPNCLNDICTVDSKNKSRKINKNAIKNIIDYLI